MDAADIPTKQDAVRTGLLARVFNALVDYSAAEFNALRDGILALRSSAAPAFRPIAKVTGTTLTLDDTYNNKVIEGSNANGLAITVPSSLSPGFRCRVWFSHVTGSITWVAGSGVTLDSGAGHLAVSVRYAPSELDFISGGLGAVGLVSGTNA